MNTASVTPTDLQDHRSRIYWDPAIQKIVYRNSALWTCITSLVRERAGFAPVRKDSSKPATLTDLPVEADPDLAPDWEHGDTCEEGRIHETWMREIWFPRNGWHVTWVEKEFDLSVGPGIIVRFHIDGALVPLAEKDNPDAQPVSLVEIKTGGAKPSERFLMLGLEAGFPSYYGQLSAPMVATGLPLDVNWKERGNGRVHTRHFETPPKTYPEIIQRVLTIEHLAATQTFPPCEQSYRDGFGFFCPHRHFHQPDPVQLERPDLEELAQEYDALNGALKSGSGVQLSAEEKKAANKRLKELRAHFDFALGQKLTLGAGNFELGYGKGSDFLDLGRFATEKPDEYKALLDEFRSRKRGNFFLRLRKV